MIMGVVNVTPDSFSDGGFFQDPYAAHDQVLRLIDHGADIIDLGAESSRPGTHLISEEEEWRRLEPVLDLLSRRELGARLSVDTNKPAVMRRVLPYGVTIINDIKGGADDQTLEFLAKNHLTYIAMHMHRLPLDMQQQPLSGDDAVNAVQEFFSRTQQRLLQAGFSKDRIWLDPGIGFGKTDSANIRLLKYSVSMAGQCTLVIGISRKSFIGRLLDIENPRERDKPSKMLELGLLLAGIQVIRTHDVQRLHSIRSLL